MLAQGQISSRVAVAASQRSVGVVGFVSGGEGCFGALCEDEEGDFIPAGSAE